VKEKPRSIKCSKTKRVRVIGVYLEPETYENIKAKSKANYLSMSDIMRQSVGKMVEDEVEV
jgi:hypothetical protein